MKIIIKKALGIEQKILTIITGIHGNESSLFMPLSKMLEEFQLENITIQLILANELAAEKNMRYIDQDLNRSFGGKKNDMKNNETNLVQEIRPYCAADLVIDFHTHRGEERFAITSSEFFNQNIKRFISALDLNHCLLTGPEVIDSGSLIDNFPNSLTVETGKHRSEKAAEFSKECLQTAVLFLQELKLNKNQVTFLKAKKFIYNTTHKKIIVSNEIKNFIPLEAGATLSPGILTTETIIPTLISYEAEPGEKILLACQKIKEEE